MGLFRKKDNRQPVETHCIVLSGDCDSCKDIFPCLLPCQREYAKEQRFKPKIK